MITFSDFLDLCEDYNRNADFVIFNKMTRALLGTARGFDQAKSKATSIRKQRGLKFDDVSFMPAEGSTKKALQHLQEGERFNMPLATTRAKDASRMSGMLRGTSTIWTNL